MPLSDYVTSTPSDPVRECEKKHGTYKSDVESIPEADRTQESSLPLASEGSPFVVGPMAPGGR